jgi:hypothetical protein
MRFAQIALVAAVVIVGFFGYTIPGHRILCEIGLPNPCKHGCSFASSSEVRQLAASSLDNSPAALASGPVSLWQSFELIMLTINVAYCRDETAGKRGPDQLRGIVTLEVRAGAT